MISEAIREILIPFLGTTLGAGSVFFIKKQLSRSLQRALTGFAAGVMVAASVFSLLLPAVEQSAPMGKFSFFPAVSGFLAGIFFLMILDRIIPHLHMNSENPEGMKSRLKRSSMMTLAVALHNLPEGMSIAAPLITGGAHKSSAIAITALSGLPTIIGALLGYSIGTMNPMLLGISLSFASGAMLYVIFGELLPESEHLWQHRLSGVATMLGVLLGLALIGAGHVH